MSLLPEPQDDGHAQELDFYQAMQDFTDMFPYMECEIIEAVLRANNGAVDATIDQLLTMGGNDCVESVRGGDVADSVHDAPTVLSPLHPESLSPADYVNTKQLDMSEEISPLTAEELRDEVPELPPKHRKPRRLSSKQSPPTPPLERGDGSLAEIMSLPPAPPPPTSHQTPPDVRSKKKSAGEGCWLPRTPPQPIPGFLHGAPSAPHPKNPAASVNKIPGERARSKSMPSTVSYKHMNPVRLYAGQGKRTKWEPLMLGDLPKDFLRLNLSPEKKKRTVDADLIQNVEANVGDLVSAQSLVKTTATKERHKRAHSSDNRSVHTSQSPSHLTSSSRSPAVRGLRQVHSENSITQSGDWLTARLVENERRRNCLDEHSHEMAQYLQDEYLALVLQNSEFLEELTRDKDFMKILQSDTSSRSGGGRASSSTAVNPAPIPYLQEPQLEDTLPQSAIEGYGSDNQEELPAFPHDCDWGNPSTGQSATQAPVSDKHKELRKQLENMGTTSRKKLADIAKRFFSRKKKSPSKPLYKSNHTPSTMNLLAEEEEEMSDHMHVPPYSPT